MFNDPILKNMKYKPAQIKLSDVLNRRQQTLQDFMEERHLNRETLGQYCAENDLQCPKLPTVKTPSQPVVKPVEVKQVVEAVEPIEVKPVAKKQKVTLPVVPDGDKKVVEPTTPETIVV